MNIRELGTRLKVFREAHDTYSKPDLVLLSDMCWALGLEIEVRSAPHNEGRVMVHGDIYPVD